MVPRIIDGLTRLEKRRDNQNEVDLPSSTAREDSIPAIELEKA